MRGCWRVLVGGAAAPERYGVAGQVRDYRVVAGPAPEPEPGIVDAAVWLGAVDDRARAWLRRAALTGSQWLVAADGALAGLAAGTPARVAMPAAAADGDATAALDALVEPVAAPGPFRARVLAAGPAGCLVRVLAGTTAPGDRLLAAPALRPVTVRSAVPAVGEAVGPGAVLRLALDPDPGLAPGDLIAVSAPLVATRVRALWDGGAALAPGSVVALRRGAMAVPARVLAAAPAAYGLTEGVLALERAVAFDLAARDPAAAALRIDAGATAAWGAITGVVPDDTEDLRAEARLRDAHWIPGSVRDSERSARFGHRPALIMVVGDDAAQRQDCARTLERRLFSAGRHAVMLDGTNLLLGLDQDLAGDAGQRELVRRFGEVVHLLLRTGAIVVGSTRAIGLGDVAAVRALVGEAPVLAVDADRDGTGPCDLRLGADGTAALAAAIEDRLPGLGVV
ncbi:MAG: hypothetical protein RLZZ127_1210 [Planctomycetota bacterium]|jgi:hypothetical protein